MSAETSQVQLFGGPLAAEKTPHDVSDDRQAFSKVNLLVLPVRAIENGSASDVARPQEAERQHVSVDDVVFLSVDPLRAKCRQSVSTTLGRASVMNLFNLNGVPPKEIAMRTWTEMRADDVFGRSAQLAYYFFLALFPFLICVIATLSVVGSADRGRALLFDLFQRFLPGPAFQLISQAFNEIIKSGGPLKMSLGILASLWSASLGVGAMMDTLNAAYKMKETRSLIKQYAVAVGLTCGIGLLLVVSVITLLFGEKIIPPATSNAVVAITEIAGWLVTLAAALLVLAATYYLAPNLIYRRWHWITPGSVVAVCLLVLVSFGLKAYIRYFGTYNVTYGSLGAVIVLLLFLYLSGVAVLSGGVLNAVLENTRRTGISAPR